MCDLQAMAEMLALHKPLEQQVGVFGDLMEQRRGLLMATSLKLPSFWQQLIKVKSTKESVPLWFPNLQMVGMHHRFFKFFLPFLYSVIYSTVTFIKLVILNSLTRSIFRQERR